MKKIIALILTLSMVLSLGIFSASAEDVEITDNLWIAEDPNTDPSLLPGEFVGYLGDADENKTVNIRDATAIQKHIAGIAQLEDTARILSDADMSGGLNIKDATAVQKQVAGITADTFIGHIIYKAFALDSRLFGTWESTADGADVINELLPLYIDDPTISQYIHIETFPIKFTYEFRDDYTYTRTVDEDTAYASLEILKADLADDLKLCLEAIAKSYGLNMTAQQMLVLLGYKSMGELIDEMMPTDMVEQMIQPAEGAYRTTPDGKIYLDQTSDTYCEYYSISGNTLTVTGNNEGLYPEAYPLTFTKIK